MSNVQVEYGSVIDSDANSAKIQLHDGSRHSNNRSNIVIYDQELDCKDKEKVVVFYNDTSSEVTSVHKLSSLKKGSAVISSCKTLLISDDTDSIIEFDQANVFVRGPSSGSYLTHRFDPQKDGPYKAGDEVQYEAIQSYSQYKAVRVFITEGGSAATPVPLPTVAAPVNSSRSMNGELSDPDPNSTGTSHLQVEYGSVLTSDANSTNIRLHDGSRRPPPDNNCRTVVYNQGLDWPEGEKVIVFYNDNTNEVYSVHNTSSLQKGSATISPCKTYLMASDTDATITFDPCNVFVRAPAPIGHQARRFNPQKDEPYKTGDLVQYEAIQSYSGLKAVRVFVASVRDSRSRTASPAAAASRESSRSRSSRPVVDMRKRSRLYGQNGIIISRDDKSRECLIWSRDMGRVMWDCTQREYDYEWSQLWKWVSFDGEKCKERNLCNWRADNLRAVAIHKLGYKRSEWDSSAIPPRCSGMVMAMNDHRAIIWSEHLGRVLVNSNTLGGKEDWRRAQLRPFLIVTFRAALCPIQDSYRDLAWKAIQVEWWPEEEEMPRFPSLKTFRGTFTLSTSPSFMISNPALGSLFFSGFDYYKDETIRIRGKPVALQIVFVPAMQHISEQMWRAVYVQPDGQGLPTIQELGFGCDFGGRQQGQPVSTENHVVAVDEGNPPPEVPPDDSLQGPNLASGEVPAAPRPVKGETVPLMLSSSGPLFHLSPPQRRIEIYKLFKTGRMTHACRAVGSQTDREMELVLLDAILNDDNLSSLVEDQLPQIDNIIARRAWQVDDDGDFCRIKNTCETQTPHRCHSSLCDELLANETLFSILLDHPQTSDFVLPLSSDGHIY